MVHARALMLATIGVLVAANGSAGLGAGEAGSAPVAPAAAAAALSAEAAYGALVEGSKDGAKAPEASVIDAAEGAIKPASASQPKDWRWVHGLALIERARMNASKDAKERRTHAVASWELYQKAAKLNNKNADLQYEVGNATMASLGPDDGFMTMASRAGDAKDAWLAGIEIDPNHIRCLTALGMYEVQARKQGGWLFGSYSKARGYADRLLKLPDGQFMGYLVLGAADAAEEEWDEMSKHYTLAETATGVGASATQAMFAHAGALLNGKKDAKAALPIIERLIAKAGPDDFSARYLRGAAKKLEGDCKGAIDDFRAVLEKNPAAQNTRYFIAECLEATGDTAGALEHYGEFVSRFPQDARAETAKKAIEKLKKQAK